MTKPKLGHNRPPPDTDLLLESGYLTDRLFKYADIAKRATVLLADAERLPAVDDATRGRITDFARKVRACINDAGSAHAKEKEPYAEQIKQLDWWRDELTGPLTELLATVRSKLDAHVRAQPERVRYHTGQGGVLAETVSIKHEIIDLRAAATSLSLLIDKEALDKAARKYIDTDRPMLRALLERDPNAQPVRGVRFRLERQALIR